MGRPDRRVRRSTLQVALGLAAEPLARRGQPTGLSVSGLGPRGARGPARGGPALGPRSRSRSRSAAGPGDRPRHRAAGRGPASDGRRSRSGGAATRRTSRRVWLFDLDNTLHDASHAAFGATNVAMTEYIAANLGLGADSASALRQHYWSRYGATLLGLVRHHAVDPRHFLEQTHLLPGLEQRLRTSPHDRAVLKRLRGRRYILTNAPRAYALRVLAHLRLADCFDGVIGIEDMTMFGQLRPKPDARMFRHVAARLKVRPVGCVLVEDTLAHQKAARGLGMTTAWMQRYLDGRFRGTLRSAANHGAKPAAGPVRRCPKPAYVCARIRSLLQLRDL